MFERESRSKICMLVFLFVFGAFKLLQAQPIALHPDNPHYFIYNEEPVVLISSSEHYGALLNRKFDYVTYLKTLAADGLNYARIFTGTYVEKPGDFGIQFNTLAPDSGDLIAPWARSQVPGYFNGGNKFDLDKWDSDYFNRLKDFLKEAEQHEIIVEVTIFSSQYRGWPYCPLHHTNNINNTDSIERDRVNTLHNGNILTYQKNFVKKLVQEINEFDNFFFEIQNEPYADVKGTQIPINTYQHQYKEKALQRIDLATTESLKWQKHIMDIIVETEKNLPKKHLNAQNYANFFYPLNHVDEEIDIINFHYTEPLACALNYGFNRPIGFDEAGFAMNDSNVYRRQAWNFILAGGALYNNLDYSFAVGFEDGTCVNDAPGYGGVQFRKEMGILKSFMESFDFIRMQPDYETVRLAPGVFRQAMSEPGEQYAIYFDGPETHVNVSLKLPDGNYTYQWINTKTGITEKQGKLEVNGNEVLIVGPDFTDDIALSVRRIKIIY